MNRRGADDDDHLPLELGPVSNGEYAPLPQTPVLRETERRARDLIDRQHAIVEVHQACSGVLVHDALAVLCGRQYLQVWRGGWQRQLTETRAAGVEYFRSQARRSQALQRFRDEVTALVAEDLEKAAACDRTELIEGLLRCIAELPERLRRVVRACLEGHKPAEVAKALCTTVGVVYNLHYRANQLLRECLQRGLP